MAMSMRVTNANGRVIATTRDGVRSYHQHDAQGNTIALINDGVVTDTYAFWPNGELRASTGSTVNPFKYGGAWGYYTDTTGRIYVRARTLRPSLARWMTVDPLWPEQRAYVYAANSPVVEIDPSGRLHCSIPRPWCTPKVQAAELDVKCEVASGSPGTYKLRVYKCMKLSCMTDCQNGPCEDCTFQQVVTDVTYWYNGEVKPGGRNQSVEMQTQLPCPGWFWRYDAPGLHSGRGGIQYECKTIGWSAPHPLAELPIKYIGKYETACFCRRGGEDREKWTFSFKVTLEKGKPKCTLL